VLPGTSFAEKDGTFTNTERRVLPVKKAIEPIGDSRPDWEIILDLSARVGYPMDYKSPEDIFGEICRLTASYAGMTYARLAEKGLQWPCPTEDHPGTVFLHKDRFTSPSGYLPRLLLGIPYISQNNFGSFSSETTRSGEANSRFGTGDDRDFLFQSHLSPLYKVDHRLEADFAAGRLQSQLILPGNPDFPNWIPLDYANIVKLLSELNA